MPSQKLAISNPQTTTPTATLPIIPELNTASGMIPTITINFRAWALAVIDIISPEGNLSANTKLQEAVTNIIPQISKNRRKLTERQNIQQALKEHVQSVSSGIKLSSTLLALQALAINMDQFPAEQKVQLLQVPKKKSIVTAIINTLEQNPEVKERRQIRAALVAALSNMRGNKYLQNREIRRKISEIIPGSTPGIAYLSAVNHFRYHIKIQSANAPLNVLKEMQIALEELSRSVPVEIPTIGIVNKAERKEIILQMIGTLKSIWQKNALLLPEVRKQLSNTIPDSNADIDARHAKLHFIRHIKNLHKEKNLQTLEEINKSLSALNENLQPQEQTPAISTVNKAAIKEIILQMIGTLKSIWGKNVLLLPEVRKQLSNIIPDSNADIDARHAKLHFIRHIKNLHKEKNLQTLEEINKSLSALDEKLQPNQSARYQHRERRTTFRATKTLSATSQRAKNLIERMVNTNFLAVRGNRSSLLALFPEADIAVANRGLKKHLLNQLAKLNETKTDEEMQLLVGQLIEVRDQKLEPAPRKSNYTSGKTRNLVSSLDFRDTKELPKNVHILRTTLRFPENTSPITALWSGMNFLGKGAHTALKLRVNDWVKLPEKEMLEVLNHRCDLFPNSRIYDTHILAFIAEKIDNKPLTMASTLAILKPNFYYGVPKEVRGETVYPDIICKDEAFFKSDTKKGHWVLIPLEVPKDSNLENYEIADAREVLIAASIYQRHSERQIFGGKIGCTSDVITTDKGKKYVSVGSTGKELTISAFSEEQMNLPMSVRVGWALRRKLPCLLPAV